MLRLKIFLLKNNMKTLTIITLLFFVAGCARVQKKEAHPSLPATPEQVSGVAQPEQPPPLKEISVQRHEEEPTKLGIILGPGGLKTFAFLGVLREFEKAGIEIHSLVGLEWGSLVGAAYSTQGRANDAEWKLFKIKKSDLPIQVTFEQKETPDEITSLEPFLDSVFETKKAEDSKIPFSCLSYLSSKDKLIENSLGPLKSIMTQCIPYPPFYKNHKGYQASPFSIREAVKSLRQRGANMIVFLNVIGLGVAPRSDLLWSELRRVLQTQKEGIDYVVDIPTKAYGMGEAETLREILTIGQKAGAIAAKNIQEKIK